MKLYFSWLRSEGEISPNCSSGVVNADGVSPLCCLLTDDGGQKFLDTISWLNEGVKRVKLVKVAGSGVVDWSRDAWGVELMKEQAKTYSLYDKNYFELLNIDSFEMVLMAWRDFIQSQPEAAVNLVVEL